MESRHDFSVEVVASAAIALHGQLDIASASRLGGMAEYARQAPTLSVDLSPLSFVDVAGARALASVLRSSGIRATHVTAARPVVALVLRTVAPELFASPTGRAESNQAQGG
jgi:anti-anti-sigma regulatory factor